MRFLAIASLFTVGAFASSCHSYYECCQGCDVQYTDTEGEWGIENNDWCFINQSLCHEENPTDYPFCNQCTVVYQDETGDWGVENNEWCFISKSKCKNSSNPSNPSNPSKVTDSYGFDVIIPVIRLVSQSGTSDFATQPVERHIANQTGMMGMGRNRELPPEPYYEECSITVEDVDGKKVKDGVKGKVKVRGNWTSNYPKKGLKISFEKAEDMLGLNGGKKFKSWVLLAEFKDGAMLRNKSAFAFSRDILGVDGLYSSDSKLVELIINDEYFGVYVLAESQQIANGRVSITKSADDYQGTDIGYLLELDAGYSMYEEAINSFSCNYNDNAPLTPFDGNGGSGKTVKPGGGFGGMGGFDWGVGGIGGGIGGGNWGNPGGQGGQNGNGQAGGIGGIGGGNWGNFGGQGGENGNGQAGGIGGGNWGNFGGQGGENGQAGGIGGGNWGNFGGQGGIGGGNWGNFGGANKKKRQFTMGGGSNMTIKSEAHSQEQHDFIEKYINNVYKILYEAAYNRKALKFNNSYTDIVDASNWTPRQAIENVLDVNSLADMFIISEMTCDADLYYSSFYMDVDFGPNGNKKLRFEAPWDFDSALGNKDRCADGKGHYAANIIPDTGGYTNNQINPWLAVIMYEDWYQDIIRSKWTKAYDSGVFTNVIDMIKYEANAYADAFDRNYQRWNNIIENSQFASELSAGAKKCKTHKEAANYLAEWLQKRVNFVNSYWHK